MTLWFNWVTELRLRFEYNYFSGVIMPEERSTNYKYLILTFYTTGSSLMFDFLDRMMNKENNKDFQMASFLI